MKRYIVTTTINKPTIALKKFSRMKDWVLIVVGDKKTPHHYYSSLKNIIYLNPADQEKIDKKLSDLIGWNCIQRRNFGYVYALSLGADFIATVDDDNIPYTNWGVIKIKNKQSARIYKSKEICFDPLSIFNFEEKLWHRGYPINLLQNYKLNKTYYKSLKKFDIQANLWDLNPDIDAINRMALKKEKIQFKNKFYYSSNKISPFNSQNTILNRETLKNYFLFPFVGRMDDIWAAYYVQSLGFRVMYGPPTVYQKRNIHNLYRDFELEKIGYDNNYNLLKKISLNPINIKKFLPLRSFEAFKRYIKITKKYV